MLKKEFKEENGETVKLRKVGLLEVLRLRNISVFGGQYVCCFYVTLQVF